MVFTTRKKFIFIAILTFAINYSLDLITKLLAVNYLKGKEAVCYLHNTIMIFYTENSGAFLSMGTDWPLFIKYIILIVLPLIVCLYGIYYCLFKENDIKRLILIVSIVAGGLGNLIDRSFNDFKVVDFLNFGVGSLRTGILNVADLSVTFGVILLLLYESRHNKEKKGLKKSLGD